VGREVLVAQIRRSGAEVIGALSHAALQAHPEALRGDAVVVNLPVWESLVRDAYRGYNAAIVAAVKADAEMTALIGGRIYDRVPVNASGIPQGPFPCCMVLAPVQPASGSRRTPAWTR
jgi:hypothetical protein